MTIDLPIQKWRSWKIVKAEIIAVDDRLPGSFAVHRNPYRWEFAKWTVSNIETGLRIGKGGATKKEAIANAIRAARQCSLQRYRRRLTIACKTTPQILDTSVVAQ
jgi:hypothetical protein